MSITSSSSEPAVAMMSKPEEKEAFGPDSISVETSTGLSQRKLSSKGRSARDSWLGIDTSEAAASSTNRRRKSMRMSSIINDGFALIDACSSTERNETTTATESTQLPTPADLSEAAASRQQSQTEPFISSLGKSLEILRKRRTATTTVFKLKPRPRAVLSTVAHLSAFSIIGEALRVFVGRLFGGACSTTDDTWMETAVTSAHLCVTSNGDALLPGGSLFIDLPANMLGSFFMGFLQPSEDLGLLITRPIVFLNSEHWFQSWDVVHLALRTGFCGSLTTFASWNTQMVRMMDGWISGGSQFFSAVLGYIIGLELALASLVLGQTIAIWIHRYTNKDLAKVEDMMVFAYSRGTEEQPSETNKMPLPDYERRYLAYLLPREEHEWAKKNVTVLEDLEKWKVSTDDYRIDVGEDEGLLTALHDIETTVLVDEDDLSEEQRRLAEQEGWDVAALQRFAKEANRVPNLKPLNVKRPDGFSSVVFQRLWASIPFVMAASILLAFALLDWKTDESTENFYREMWMSSLFAPFGTIVRWMLASWNGSLNGSLEWFPLGTFTANIVASMISALVAGVSDSWKLNEATAQVLFAVKSGLAGSMSTVSTYVVEGNLLQKTYRHHAKAYYYMIGTILTACCLGLVIYSPLVRAGSE